MNEDEYMPHQNLWEATKAVLIRKVISVNTSIKKKKKRRHRWVKGKGIQKSGSILLMLLMIFVKKKKYFESIK